jgi:AcrR family transcriptional regulator
MVVARTTRRRIGRPRPVPGADARELLIDAAVALFAERGIAGTTIAEIAAKAKVTPAMVHYYFTNRGRLLDAIAGERLLRSITAVWSPVVEDREVLPMLRGLVQRILAATEASPWLPSLWLREIVSEGGQLRSRLLKIAPFENACHLIDAVMTAQDRGEINPQLEPRLVVISVIGLTLLPIASLGAWKEIPVVPQGVTREDIARHAEALLVSAFSKPSRRRRHAVRKT